MLSFKVSSCHSFLRTYIVLVHNLTRRVKAVEDRTRNHGAWLSYAIHRKHYFFFIVKRQNGGAVLYYKHSTIEKQLRPLEITQSSIRDDHTIPLDVLQPITGTR